MVVIQAIGIAEMSLINLIKLALFGIIWNADATSSYEYNSQSELSS